MPKTKISEYSSTASDNTDIDGINLGEGMLPSDVNNAMRELMAQIKDLQAGTSGDSIPVAAGGTSLTTLTANNVILGNGTSSPLFVAPGTSGNVLTSNGTTWTSAEVPAGGLTYLYKTANYTAVDKEGVLADTAGGSFTVTLPATPTTGVQVVVADAGGAWGTNNLTVGRNGSTISGLAENLVCDITGASVQLVYDGTTWEVYAQVGGNGGTAVTLDGVQTLTNKTINGSSNTLSNVSLSTAVTGTLPAANGGTGLTSPGTTGNVLTSDGTNWTSAALPTSGEKTWTAVTATGSYTVPTGVTSIRAYAFGKGGNGVSGTANGGAGGGGGCAFGDIAVTPGGTVSIDITSGIATVSIGATTYLTANPGANGSGTTGGAGGTASKDVSVTNGGAYSGGDGGRGGGGAAGSPLGIGGFGGSSAGGGGGGGAGGAGASISSGGGGGAGGVGQAENGGGSGGPASTLHNGSGGPSRSFESRFTDPILAHCDSAGANKNFGSEGFGPNAPGPGGGGAGSNGVSSPRAGKGGDFAGGGAVGYSSGTAIGGAGGFGGGGGSSYKTDTSQFGGTGGAGGYGGGGGAPSGAGGAAIVLIYA